LCQLIATETQLRKLRMWHAHKCTGVHIFGDAKKILPKFDRVFPKVHANSKSFDVKTKTYHCKQIKVSACLITNYWVQSRTLSTSSQYSA